MRRFRKKARVCAYQLRKRVKQTRRRISGALSRRKALLWHQLYVVRYRCLVWLARHGAVAAALTLFLLIGVSAIWIPALQDALNPQFGTEAQLESLRVTVPNPWRGAYRGRCHRVFARAVRHAG